MTNQTNIERVQAQFIAEIEKNGIVHVLRWVSEWYDKAAGAEVQDELFRALGQPDLEPEAKELVLLDRLLPEAESNSSFSTSPGHNLYKQALIAARARELNNMLSSAPDSKIPATPASRRGRRERWERWREQRETRQANKASKPKKAKN